MIQKLLQRWSELEPDRCRADRFSGDYLVCIKDTALEWLMSYVSSSERKEFDLSALQYGLQKSIVVHGLRIKLENASDG